MTPQERTAAIEHTLTGLEFYSSGPCPGCEECGLGDVDSMDDPRYENAQTPSFSWHPCELCGSTLGGDRHHAHAVDVSDGRRIYHFDICTDCLTGEDDE